MLSIKEIEEVIPGQNSIGTGFCKSRSGKTLFAGTLARDGKVADGHIIKIDINANGTLSVRDVGVPVKGEGVFALSLDADKNVFYGITHPSGKFFTYDLKSGKTELYTDIMPSAQESKTYGSDLALKPKDWLCRALVIDKRGRVYGSKPGNRLFYFDPATRKINILKEELPAVWGREVIGRIDAWLKMPNGDIYGSNAADGHLFKLDIEKGTVINLGKPVMMNRLMAMAPGKNGMLYGVAGAAPGYAHLFSYHPEKGFKDLGNPEFKMVAPGLEQGIAWRGFQIASMAASENGNHIVLGENESLSQLLVFPAE